MVQLEFLTYSVELLPPLGKRSGLVIRAIHEGDDYLVEASPLPKWSRDSFAQVVEEALFSKKAWEIDLVKGLARCQSPSLQFALESLLRQLQTERKKYQIRTQGILFPNEVSSPCQIAQFATWKIKVRSFNDWMRIAPHFASASAIRLDANRALDHTELDLFKPYEQIDYIEEPTLDLTSCPLPFALDESLRNHLSSAALLPQCKAYILKPTLQGNLQRCQHLLEQALKLKKKIVISSSIESPIGLYQLAHLKKDISNETAWGLGTYRYFPADFCNPIPQWLSPDIVEFSPITHINKKYITRIA